MHLRERVYSRLPVSLQNVACQLEARRVARRRFSPQFFALLEEVQERDKLGADELRSYLVKRLRHSLALAQESSPYYRQLFAQYDFDPGRLTAPEELQRLPIQTKDTVREHLADMVNPAVSGRRRLVSHTSGTTGSGLIFPETVECERERWAIWWRYRGRLGLRFGTWCALFGGRLVVPIRQRRPPYWRIAAPTRQVMFSMYHLNERSAAAYVNQINRMRLPWLHGYPSTLSHLAWLMLDQGIHLDCPPQFVTTGAENVLDNQAALITRAFGVEALQHYGLAEPVGNISRCPQGRLHVDEDYAFVELLPVGGDGRLCRVIGTSIVNDALLFLRYDTKDLVTLATDQSCSCGATGRIIETIDGRQEDSVVLPDGTRIGRLDHIFKDMVNVREAQIRQDATGWITFLVVRGSAYGERDERQLRREIESRLPIRGGFAVSYVDEIPRTSAGKLRFVISDCTGASAD